MNGNENTLQRLGDDFLKMVEHIINEVYEKQGVKLSVAKVTNMFTRHEAFEEIQTDTINYDFKARPEKWKFF